VDSNFTNRTEIMLDLLRWGSACLVAVGHLRNLLFVDYGDLYAPSLQLRLFYFATGFGNEAVIVFFVISGYLVGGKLALEGAAPGTLINYFVHRFSRIYIVLLPALALTFALDVAGASLPGGVVLYQKGGWSSALYFASADRHSLATLLCNALNLQDAYCETFGSNGPLWSLAYEWFYYITFPFLLMLVSNLRRNLLGLQNGVLCTIAIAAIIFCFSSYVIYYPIWLAGAIARLVVTRVRLHWIGSFGGVAILILVMAVSRLHPSLVMHYAIGIVLSLILANLTAAGSRLRGPKFHQFMASFSYSLYVVHLPLMVFTMATLLSLGVITSRSVADSKTFGLFLIMISVVYILSWCFSVVTERNTNALRQFINKHVPVRSQAPHRPTPTVSSENDLK
jgi:peptidoglycan/LPS O-acetylase OafA/YrhL